MEIKEYKWSITDRRDSQPRAQEATRTGFNILLKTFNISKIFPLQITGTCCALSQRFVLFLYIVLRFDIREWPPELLNSWTMMEQDNVQCA